MKKGFTLVEVLIVIAIVGLLSAMAIPAIHKQRQMDESRRRGYNVEKIIDHELIPQDHIEQVNRPVVVPYECSQILNIDGTKVYRFRQGSGDSWTFMVIGNSSGTPVSIGH